MSSSEEGIDSEKNESDLVSDAENGSIRSHTFDIHLERHSDLDSSDNGASTNISNSSSDSGERRRSKRPHRDSSSSGSLKYVTDSTIIVSFLSSNSQPDDFDKSCDRENLELLPALSSDQEEGNALTFSEAASMHYMQIQKMIRYEENDAANNNHILQDLESFSCH